ncbi:MAG: class IV adenylate cyclase [Treponema sp.]|jgi:adenylate cyclase class 2|nr:class IV adenylate cyclase [Treponema sp.]
MAIEIELKAWVENPGQIKERLFKIARYEGEFLKEDAYWGRDGETPGMSPRQRRRLDLPLSGVRIRKLFRGLGAQKGDGQHSIVVTYKTKEVREGIEVNQEDEFEVSPGEPFEGLLKRMGLKPSFTKRKQGASWNFEGITAELTEVAGLGWFAELEILAEDEKKETVENARKRLLGLLEEIGIGEDKIESRYYTEMLKGIKNGGN